VQRQPLLLDAHLQPRADDPSPTPSTLVILPTLTPAMRTGEFGRMLFALGTTALTV
jgi:hypothetical protein